MKSCKRYSIIIPLFLAMLAIAPPAFAEAAKFVVQLTRDNTSFGHRKAFFQIDRVLNDLGEKNLDIVVVAYEDGIKSLTSDARTAQMLTKLANRGVKFKACKISMNAWNLTEDDFPLEVEFVPAGATEMIKQRIKGYQYWKQ